MKTIEDVACLRNLAFDHFEVRFPKITADSLELKTALLAKMIKKEQKCLDGPILTNKEESSTGRINLVNESEIFMASLILDFIHANGCDILQTTMLESVIDDGLD